MTIVWPTQLAAKRPLVLEWRSVLVLVILFAGQNRDAESVSLGQCGKNTFKRNVDVGKPFSCKKECENGTTCRTAYVSSEHIATCLNFVI